MTVSSWSAPAIVLQLVRVLAYGCPGRLRFYRLSWGGTGFLFAKNISRIPRHLMTPMCDLLIDTFSRQQILSSTDVYPFN